MGPEQRYDGHPPAEQALDVVINPQMIIDWPAPTEKGARTLLTSRNRSCSG